MELVEGLLEACSSGDPVLVSSYLQQSIQYGIDLNFATNEGFTLLTHTITAAASNPHGQYLEVIQMLLETGIYLESADTTYGRTAAHWAAYNQLSDILTLLMMTGCNMAAYDMEGQIPLHVAIISRSQDCVNAVIQFVTPEIPEIPTLSGLTPLMLAVQQGDIKICQLLLQAGSNPNVIEEIAEQSALHMAAERGFASIVELLIRNRSVLDANDGRGVTPVHLAAIQIQSDVLNVICDIVGSEILELPDATGLTPLMHACVSGSEECVKFILKKKTNLLIKDTMEGKTCLHWACHSISTSPTIIQMLCKKKKQLLEEPDVYGRTALHLATISGNVEALKVLQSVGCDINAVDTHKQYTAVHWAAVSGQPATLTELLAYGISPNVKDTAGATPLHLASQAAAIPTDEQADPTLTIISQGALKCIEVLLNAGASVDAIDNQQLTPLHWALQCSNNQQGLELLILNGADPKKQNSEGLTGLHVAAKYGAVDNCQFLIEVAGVHGNIEDNYKQTALFYSIESQAHSCSEYLLSIGCSPNHRNKDQRSPVHIAASIGSVEGLQLLKVYGGDFDIQSAQYTSPLHDAAANGNTAALQFLLTSGCDPNISVDKSNLASPLHFAVSGGHAECVQMLIENGANINAIMISEEGQALSPLDYVADDPTLLELIQSSGGLPGVQLYKPSEEVEKDKEMDKEKKEDDITLVEEVPLSDEAMIETEPHKKDGDDVLKKPLLVIPIAKPVSVRPGSGIEVFDHLSQQRKVDDDRFPTRRPNILSRALSLLRQKSPPPDSILSSTIGLYAAQATLLAACVIGTPLGEKTIEIASKVANDTAEELKKQAEEIDSEPIELEWILEPEIKEPTPPPEPTPELPPTPAPSPPPKVELHMDALERRMRKAKAQMDETKSLGYRAVEELIKAQSTQAQLKRHFVMANVKEECKKRREKFLNQEAEANKESEHLVTQYNQRMEKATRVFSNVNEMIDKQISDAHERNKEVAQEMSKLGINPRLTVAEWMQKKQEQKRSQIKDTLQDWERTKQQREVAISLKQAITSHRALQHVAWSVKKDLSAQMKALDQPKTIKPGTRTLTTSGAMKRITPKISTRTESRTNNVMTEKRFISTGCIRATPTGFVKTREEPKSPTHKSGPKRSTSLPDSTLWDMGRSYIGFRTPFYQGMDHRAYGSKHVHAERTLHFMTPEDYNKLRSQSRSTQSRRCHTTISTSKSFPRHLFTQQNTNVQYHSLAESYPSVRQRKTKATILPMKILDSPPEITT